MPSLTLLAAALRFATLDRQSFWSDEAITVLLVRMDLGGMLSTVAETESTPPVYYVLAWVWASVFGDGEIGLRSLSALAGVATVPVAYLAGAALFGRRAGIAAATLVAVSPPLGWYSHEARSYALAVLLVGVSFAAYRSGRPTGLFASVDTGGEDTQSAYRRYLVRELPDILVTTDRERARLGPVVTQALVEAAASELGFERIDRLQVPDGRELSVWVLRRDS